jgi:hypothetical protein
MVIIVRLLGYSTTFCETHRMGCVSIIVSGKSKTIGNQEATFKVNSERNGEYHSQRRVPLNTQSMFLSNTNQKATFIIAVFSCCGNLVYDQMSYKTRKEAKFYVA